MKKIIFITFIFAFTAAVQASELIQYDLRVDGMTCPFCLATSEKTLKKHDGVEHISSNLDNGVISVCGPTSLVFDEVELSSLFKTKGFTYRSLEKLEACSLLGIDTDLKGAVTEIQEHVHSDKHNAVHSHE